MNKKKIEKIITHNIPKGDFNNINIDYSKYKKKLSFKEFIFSKRVLKYVCPLLALAISIPFIPSLFNNKNMSSNLVNESSVNNSEAEMNQSSMTTSNAESSMLCEASSSSSSQFTFYIDTISVNGVIILKDDKKMFYTDESYGYHNELNNGKEFTYMGYYDIDHLNNYNELNVNDYCYADIVVDPGISEFKVNDIYELHIIESA